MYGGGLTLPYLFDTTTSDPAPNQYFRLNNGTQPSATIAYVSSYPPGLGDQSTLLSHLADSTNTVKGTVTFRHLTDPAKFVSFQLTGISSVFEGYELSITNIGYGTAFEDEDPCLMCFSTAGDLGATGPTGDAGPTGPTGEGASTSQQFCARCDLTQETGYYTSFEGEVQNAAEDPVQIMMYQDGTINAMRLGFSSGASMSSHSFTVNLRINGSTKTMGFSQSDTTPGVDSSNPEDITAGDLVCAYYGLAGESGSPAGWAYITIIFTPDPPT
jgi:hypothetical protein